MKINCFLLEKVHTVNFMENYCCVPVFVETIKSLTFHFSFKQIQTKLISLGLEIANSLTYKKLPVFIPQETMTDRQEKRS